MKKLIFLLFFLPSISYGACDPKNDIKKVEGGYLYTPDCHKWVGKNVLDNKGYQSIMPTYETALKYQEQVIELERERVKNFKETSNQLRELIEKKDKWNSYNGYINFGLGLLTGLGTVWVANQISK